MSGSRERSPTLFQRGKGNIWWYRFTDPKSGKQVRESTGTTQRDEAQKIADIALDMAYKAYEDEISGKSTVVKVERLWLEASIRWIEERADKKRSIDSDAGRLEILGTVMNDKKMSEIDGEFIRDKVVKGLLQKRGIAPSTINRYLVMVQSILNAAYREWEWIDRVPYINKPGLAGERRRKAWFTPTQYKRLVDALPEHYSDMMQLGIATGMRYANINDLRWNQIDLSRNAILIPKEEFKGKRDHIVPINKTAKSVLMRLHGTHPHRVFTYKGDPIERINLRHWHNVLDKLGINDELREAGLLAHDEKAVFHSLRHTFATWLGRTGVPLDVIESIGGWSSGKNRVVTGYAHLAGVNHLLPYARKIDDILEGKIKGISTILAHDQWTNLAQTP